MYQYRKSDGGLLDYTATGRKVEYLRIKNAGVFRHEHFDWVALGYVDGKMVTTRGHKCNTRNLAMDVLIRKVSSLYPVK